MMWDMKLIRALFGFGYTWEIYIRQINGNMALRPAAAVQESFAGQVERLLKRNSTRQLGTSGMKTMQADKKTS